MGEKELIYLVIGIIAGKIITDILFTDKKSTDLLIDALDTNEGILLLNSIHFKNFISTPQALSFIESLDESTSKKLIDAM